MLTATQRPQPEGSAPHRRGTILSLLASAGFHLAALALLLLPAGRPMPAPNAPIEIEMVQQEAQQTGAPQPPPQPQAPAPSDATATPSSSAASPPAFAAPQAPAPADPKTATAPAQPPTKPAPEVNLGNAIEDEDPLSVTGDNVVPPKPDARYHNLPPRYPPGAARSGAEGVVQIVAHILPNGFPAAVDIAGSSGNAELDAEARRAVLLWRFTPARNGGQAVPFDYVVNIRFALGAR